MTAITKPEPASKAAAIREQIPVSIRQKIEENRMRNAVVAEIRGTQWGNSLSVSAARAVAQWAHDRGADPVTEVELLGGRVYLNVAYFRRRGAPLLRDGTVDGIRHDQIGRDVRLDELVRECEALAKQAADAGAADEATHWRAEAFAARREIMRRKSARVAANAPENAAAVCVTAIILANGVEVRGANWCGGGIRKGDPVGDAEPAKTAESRSERRAWIKLITGDEGKDVPAVQSLAREHREAVEDGAVLSDLIVEEQAQITAGHEAARPKMLAAAGVEDVYAPAAPEGELFAVPAPVVRTSMDPEAAA